MGCRRDPAVCGPVVPSNNPQLTTRELSDVNCTLKGFNNVHDHDDVDRRRPFAQAFRREPRIPYLLALYSSAIRNLVGVMDVTTASISPAQHASLFPS